MNFVLVHSDFSHKRDGNSVAVYCPKAVVFTNVLATPDKSSIILMGVFSGDCVVYILEQNSRFFQFPVVINFNIRVPLYDVCLKELSVAKEIHCLVNA